ncbi:type II toxin-antitoxin system RelE/ParE family toxin [Pseudomonas gingeri]|uniref:type II toxin-antitoxin system RelE family toxin n=1 Tax=Pseudomonas gingeri TaxID=117681 RepID=UPI0015A0D494|nr:type II toxin-antitoxin system RelE/ParE family toxin [Pseudomonas gingeri]NVZ25639.1 type II toxin-antitoxin system RelE/ParE family toxin [Pseudomonas gingeri]
MGAEYSIEWDPKALKELRNLDAVLRVQLLRKLEERRHAPRVSGDALHGLKDCYKIKLRGSGYRLVYRVEDERIVVVVLAIGKRERSAVYEQARKRT